MMKNSWDERKQWSAKSTVFFNLLVVALPGYPILWSTIAMPLKMRGFDTVQFTCTR
jgi:hypothetical protein